MRPILRTLALLLASVPASSPIALATGGTAATGRSGSGPDPSGVGATSAPADERRPAPGSPGDLARRLGSRRVEVAWRDLPLSEALADLSRQLDVPVILTPAAADLADTLVRLELKKVRARTLLKLMAGSYGFKVLQQGSMLWVTTPEDAVKRTAVLALYDLRPILHVPPDFPGPEIGLRPPGEFRDEPPPREIAREAPDPSEIVDLLRRATGESEWEYESVSIQALGRRLVVRHSPSMQARIARILVQLGPG